MILEIMNYATMHDTTHWHLQKFIGCVWRPTYKPFVEYSLEIGTDLTVINMVIRIYNYDFQKIKDPIMVYEPNSQFF
jgi:hypothetical protein